MSKCSDVMVRCRSPEMKQLYLFVNNYRERAANYMVKNGKSSIINVFINDMFIMQIYL